MIGLIMACSGAPTDTAVPVASPAVAGPWSVGHRLVVLNDSARPLTVSVWYPTVAETVHTGVAEAYLHGTQQSDYAALLEAADPRCPSWTTASVLHAVQAEGGPWPAVIFSHCHTCTRFSSFTVAERLASHGIVVIAPDHAGNTLFDAEPLGLSAETLALRREDGIRALDALLSGDLGVTSVDEGALGTVGHSFGSVTAGLIAQTDPRIVSTMGIAAPMENPLLPGVDMDSIMMPLMLMVAEEDNSISEAGNVLIRSNFTSAPGPAWKAEVADVGHWSFSDLCGLVERFEPGCGAGERQTVPGEAFTYLDPDQGRHIVSTLAAAFFLQTLAGQDGLVDELSLEGVYLEWR